MDTLGKIEKTERGFEFIEFDDYYGAACSLQQSSIAIREISGASAIWLGLDPCENGFPLNDPKYTRMHLSYDQVRALVHSLNNWLEYGTFHGYRSGE